MSSYLPQARIEPTWQLIAPGSANTAASSVQLPSALSPPTPQMLASLRAVPRGNLSHGKRRGRPGKGKIFNIQADRPQSVLQPAGNSIMVVDEITNVFVTTSVGGPVYAGAQFTLNMFSNAAEYTALFDQYRIDEIEVWIESSEVMSATVGSAAFHTAIDLDDANVPTAISQVSGKQNALTSLVGTGHYHKFQPHMAVAVYSGTFTSFGNEPAGWIDVASPTVAHYGLKLATAAADGAARLIYLTTRAKISFRAAGL